MKCFNNSKIKSIAKFTAKSTARISYTCPLSMKIGGKSLRSKKIKCVLKKNMLLQHKEAVFSQGQIQNVRYIIAA